MIYAYIFAGIIVSFYVLWILYLAVMNLARAKHNGLLSPLAQALGTPILLVGWLLDFVLNVFVMSFVLLEFPLESTISERLERHNNTSTGWRKSVALWAEQLLDPYDPDGNHI